MEVRAIARGFYGRLREPGDVFEIGEDNDLGSWMDPTDAKDRERLAERLAKFGSTRRPAPGPNVPPTTGPGYQAVAKEPVRPKPIAAAAPKPAAPKEPPPPKA